MLKSFRRILQILRLRQRNERYEYEDLAKKWGVHPKTVRRLDLTATRFTEMLKEMGIQLVFRL